MNKFEPYGTSLYAMGSFVKEHLKAASRLFDLSDFQYYLTQKMILSKNKMMWSIYEIIHIWTGVMNESEEYNNNNNSNSN